MTGEEFSRINLDVVFDKATVRPLRARHRIVIFSDLHMGNGGRNDVFAPNAEIFARVLQRYYDEHGYHLILNGDVEDLQRFSRASMQRRWKDVYEVFDHFHASDRLTRIVGNHDIDIMDANDERYPPLEALRLRWRDDDVFIFHGHQTSRWYERHSKWVRFLLRYVPNPLHLKNISVSHDSQKRFWVERRAYNFATSRKVLAIIGHTHRPLFESMSKIDTIQFEIERLCRKFPEAKKQHKIERRITDLKSELMRVVAAEEEARPKWPPWGQDLDRSTSLYREHLLVPSLFNSGCVLGKRGMTALELSDGQLRLVYWFDNIRRRERRLYAAHDTLQLDGSTYSRVVIQQDTLDYIFARIRLLA